MSGFIPTIKNAWQRNRLGPGMFITGMTLCMAGIILSLFLKLSFGSFSENTPYVVAMIGIGITFILTGINIILLPPRIPKWYVGIYKKYIEGNEILIIECIVPIILMVLLFESYPEGWHYPQLYIISVPFAICMSLMAANILFNANEKDTEIYYIRKELELRGTAIKEKDELARDSATPDYVIEFADKLKRNIDELKSVMDDLKTSIDDGTKGISERAALTVNKYRADNEQLHDDVQKFKQRMEKEKDEFKERVNERVIKNLMNMLYSIEELKQYKDKEANYTVGDIEKIKEDIYNVLKNEDVEIINPHIGDDFDDKKCCAVQTVETDKFPEKKIVDIKKIGYMFKSGKVIKYADVIVSKGKTDEDNKAKTEATKADNNAKTEATKADNNAKTDVIVSKGKTDEDNKAKTKTKTEKDKSNVKTEDTKLDGDKIEDTKVKTDDKTGKKK